MHDQPNQGADAAPVVLSAPHLAYVRRLLFDDLREIAEVLAREANAATEAPAPRDEVAGLDARSTYHVLMGTVADVLDVVGWDVSGDTALMIDTERERRRSTDGR